jgi:hypothetical protein
MAQIQLPYSSYKICKENSVSQNPLLSSEGKIRLSDLLAGGVGTGMWSESLIPDHSDTTSTICKSQILENAPELLYYVYIS